jgi:hypothetical protein
MNGWGNETVCHLVSTCQFFADCLGKVAFQARYSEFANNLKKAHGEIYYYAEDSFKLLLYGKDDAMQSKRSRTQNTINVNNLEFDRRYDEESKRSSRNQRSAVEIYTASVLRHVRRPHLIHPTRTSVSLDPFITPYISYPTVIDVQHVSAYMI